MNGQLWTIPWELKCYIALAAAALAGIYRRRTLFLVLYALAQIVLVLHDLKIEHPEFGVTGRNLVLCFLGGVAIHLYRERIPCSIAALAIAISAIALIHLVPQGNYLMSLPTAYITVWLGLTNPRKVWPVDTGDYSYGIFLYGSPIQQRWLPLCQRPAVTG